MGFDESLCAHKREQANRAACHLLYVLLNKEELTINPLTSFPAPPALVANIYIYIYKYTYMFFSAETSSCHYSCHFSSPLPRLLRRAGCLLSSSPLISFLFISFNFLSSLFLACRHKIRASRLTHAARRGRLYEVTGRGLTVKKNRRNGRNRRGDLKCKSC